MGARIRAAAARQRQRAVISLVGLGLVLAPPAKAIDTPYNAIEGSALAIAAYEASKEQCGYSERLGKAMTDIDAFFARRHGYAWTRAKQSGPEMLIRMRNVGRVLGAQSDCVIYGKAIGYVLPAYLNAVDMDPQVVAELSTLLSGKDAAPGNRGAEPAPAPAPGSAAETVAELKRQYPNMNRSAEPEGFRSTLSRVGPNRDRGGAVAQAPAQQPSDAVAPRSGPPPQGHPTASAAERTAPPPGARPHEALPLAPRGNTAVVANTGRAIPLASAAGAATCPINTECRLEEATFACNLDDATRLAQAGPSAGTQAGLAAVQGSRCETVAAGRLLRFEATASPQVVYATDRGVHVGYLPVGIFAPAGTAETTTCRAPGFCAIRPGPQVQACPTAESLALPTPEARTAAKCVTLSPGQVGEVVSVPAGMGPIAVRFGGNPPFLATYYLGRADLASIEVQPTPTPASRGWCRPGDWCLIDAPALLCREKAASERVAASPLGEARRAAIMAEPSCRVVIRGNPMKPSALPVPGEGRKLIEVEHPVYKSGWTNAAAFTVVAYAPPIRYTARLSDIRVSAGRTPALTAVSLSAQGTRDAAGMFRSGAKERAEFCKGYHSEDDPSALRSCMAEPDTSLTVAANCEAKQVKLYGTLYALEERPHDADPDIHVDASRQWLFRDVASREWLDGTTASDEVSVATAFNALCPGTNPDAAFGIAYRDPNARFPQELQGRWFDNRRACADPQRDAADYEEHAVMAITAQERAGNREFEFPQRINEVRHLGSRSWQIDSSHRVDARDVPEIFGSATYTLTRAGLKLTRDGTTSIWVLCH